MWSRPLVFPLTIIIEKMNEKYMDPRIKAEKFWDRTVSYYDKVEKNDVSYLIYIEKA